jgi:hypothetical protein
MPDVPPYPAEENHRILFETKVIAVEEFPAFMRNPANRIRRSSQYTKDIEGYVFDGADGSQMAFWTFFADTPTSTSTTTTNISSACTGATP